MSELTRYIAAGLANVAVSYGLYAALALVLPYPVAYTIGYAAGIAVSYYLNARFVFRAQMRLGSAARYPLVYAAQYLVGVVLLALLVERVGVDRLLAPLVVVLATVPLTFVLSRLIIRG
jgi:putative flippase GtrA